jgi:uncharacterized phiE125 gp8 family phage protein
MPTKSTTLFSLAAVRTYLSIKGVANTDDDALLVQVADGVSEQVEQMTSRRFVNREVVEVLNARGRDSVLLRYMPAADVTAVRTRVHVSEAWAAEDVDDFELDGFTGRLYAKNGDFPSGPLTTEVTYTAGYDDQDGANLPAALVQAALAWVEFVYKRKKVGVIVTSTGINGNNITMVPKPPKDIEDAIMSFKKYRGVHLG